MRELDKMLEKIAKNSDFTAKDTAIDKHDDLEVFKMQKSLGNSLTTMIIDNQEDDHLISDLSTPIGEEKKDSGKAMKQLLPRHGAVKKEEYPEKLAELVFPTGLVHVGSDKKEEQAVLVTEENRKDKQKDPLHNNQRKVYKNRPVDKREGSQISISQNWQDGSVALISSINKKPSKITGDAKKIIKGEEESGNLKQVLPFLDQGKEVAEKKELQKARSELNLENDPINKEKSSLKKSAADKSINKKNLITEKKKSKEMEFSKKLGNSLKIAKESTQKLTQDDFFDLLLKKRRRKEQEEKGGEQEFVPEVEEEKEKEKE